MHPFHLPASTHIGYVHLQTSHIEDLLKFYIDLLGFREIKREGNTAFLSADEGKAAKILLTEDPNLVPHNKQSPGLFHTAILLPTRFALAQMLQRLLANNIRLGFGDHGVSEAIYLSDPDGNGVELYADRPREQWPISNGVIEMYTAPVNTAGLLNELKKQTNTWNGIDPHATIGHVHLQVSDLTKAAVFYHQLIGFDITQDSYQGALFVSAGGYHHHLGLNTWYSRNMPPVPINMAGLRAYSIIVDNPVTLATLQQRMEEAGITTKLVANELIVNDSDGILVRIEVDK